MASDSLWRSITTLIAVLSRDTMITSPVLVLYKGGPVLESTFPSSGAQGNEMPSKKHKASELEDEHPRNSNSGKLERRGKEPRLADIQYAGKIHDADEFPFEIHCPPDLCNFLDGDGPLDVF